MSQDPVALRRRPTVVVFDVVETLASLDPVAHRLTGMGLPADLLPRWFTRLLRDAAALTVTGDYAPFAEVAASALHAELGSELSDADIQYAVAGFTLLEPQSDTVAALRAAAAAGLRIFTLSNGAVASTRAFLQRAGVAELVEQVLSIDQVRAWKPARAPYDLAVTCAGVAAEQLALVAVHSWDIHGAHAAGLTTGWCPRLEGSPTPVFSHADVIGTDLVDVIGQLADLPR
jgi:2-haloacid dehalogenase